MLRLPVFLTVLIGVVAGLNWLVVLVVRRAKHPVLQGLIWLLVCSNVAILLWSLALALYIRMTVLILLGSASLSLGIYRFVACWLQWKSVVIEEYPPRQQ